VDCLVTRGPGFIGSSLVDALIVRGHRVAVIDNLSTGKRANLTGGLAAGAELHEVGAASAGARMSASPKGWGGFL